MPALVLVHGDYRIPLDYENPLITKPERRRLAIMAKHVRQPVAVAHVPRPRPAQHLIQLDHQAREPLPGLAALLPLTGRVHGYPSDTMHRVNRRSVSICDGVIHADSASTPSDALHLVS